MITLNEFLDAAFVSSSLKVLSAKTGRVLIVNAAKQDKRKAFGGLHINGIRPAIEAHSNGDYARVILTCYCGEEEYKRIKAEQEARNAAD